MMMQFLPLVWSNFVRNRARLTFTLIAVVSAFALFGMLAAIGDYFLGANRFSTNDRVFIQPKVADSLPLAYVSRVSALPGVRFGRADYGVGQGAYYQDQRNFIGPVAVNLYFSYAVDPSGRFVWDPEQFRQYTADRTGVLVHESLGAAVWLEAGRRDPDHDPSRDPHRWQSGVANDGARHVPVP